MSTTQPHKNNTKREKLILAADELIKERTFHTTTLDHIAKKAEVPLGNVYYYFKTKDDILKAIVHKRTVELNTQFSEWEALSTPKARLEAFIQHYTETANETARYGCKMGSLCEELGKSGGELSDIAAALMHRSLEWLGAQFKALGKADKAEMLAQHLMSSVQGASLLTLAFKDPAVAQKQNKMLEKWLDAA